MTKSEQSGCSSKKEKSELQEKPIRVLQFIGSLDLGGSQSMIMNLYRNIDREKIQFDFVIDRKNETFHKKEIEAYGGKVFVFDEYFKGLNYFRYCRQWKEFFKKHPEYRIIHCHVRSVASIVLKIAKKNGLKTICHSHSTSNGKGVKVAAKRFLQRRIKDYSDYCFACSEESAKWLYGEEMAESDKCVIVKNAVDASKYSFNKDVRTRVRKDLGVEDRIVLGQVGRLEAVKNYTFSLDLLKRLLDQDNRYHLLIVGTGSLKEDILKKAEALNIKKCITILENRNDVNEIMQAMDIFIMPSLWEGLPVALVEAQASSLPCVISDTIMDGIVDKALVKKMSLGRINAWVKEIMELSDRKMGRVNNETLIKQSGFDIEGNIEKLCEYYCILSRRDRLKIVFCLGSMEHGGAERVVANLSNYFVEQNDVKIVVTKRWKPEYLLNDNVGHFVLDKGVSRGNVLKRTIVRTKRLRGIIKDESPDIVIAFLPEPSFRLMIAKTFLPVKTIISVRNDPNVEYNSWAKKLLVKILYPKADGFVFQTPDAQKWFSKKIQQKSIVIPNPVDSSFLCEPYDGEREKLIVNVGRLVEQKNHRLLVDAFSEFYKSHNDYRLEIYGDGPLKSELQSHINELGLDGVILLMGETQDVKKKIYKAKMFVLTSNYEGMPNSLLEAMALGLPCISTDCPIGGPHLLIRNKYNGILVQVGVGKQLLKAMLDLVSDGQLSKTLSNGASVSSKKYSIFQIATTWYDFVATTIVGGIDGRD